MIIHGSVERPGDSPVKHPGEPGELLTAMGEVSTVASPVAEPRAFDEPVTVYLCARFSRRHEMQIYRDLITRLGHKCNSRWLDVEGNDPALYPQHARGDLSDIFKSDGVIAFTELPDVGYYTGGRMVEIGYALAHDVPVCLIGPRENIFCHLPEVMVAQSVEDAIGKILEIRDPEHLPARF